MQPEEENPIDQETEAKAEQRPELKDLEQILRGERTASLGEFLGDVHAADLAEWLVELSDPDVARVVAVLDTDARSELLSFAEDKVRTNVLRYLDVPQMVAVVEELPADEVVDVLALAEPGMRERVLRALDIERAKDLRELGRHEADTAGGLMTSEYVTVDAEVNVGDAIKLVRLEDSPASEDEVGVFVIDDAGKPVGFVSDRELLTTPIHTPVNEVMETGLITVHAQDDQEEVANLVRKYSFDALPVVDDEGVLIGVVSAEDALDVLAEEAEEDILRLVGTSPEEQQTRLPVLVRVRHRLPLQGLTVLGGLLTAFILDQALPASVVGAPGAAAGTADLLRYLPIIIGLAGNVGIQSSTILVRAFATGEVSQDRESAVIASEVIVGSIIGLICGLTTTGIAGLLEGSYAFGAAVGVAISVAVSWAALLGCIVPIFCRRGGIDPAIVAGPFLITLSDISGAGIFVLVGKLILELGT